MNEKVDSCSYWQSTYGLPQVKELSLDELITRLSDILVNFKVELNNGTPSLITPYGGRRLAYLLQQTMKEIEKRRKGLSGSVFEEKPFRLNKESVTFDRRCQKVLERYPDGVLLKYGKRKHVMDMIEKGLFRIAPASSYDNESYNSAIKDNELERVNSVSPQYVDINVVNDDGSKGEAISIIGPVEYKSVIGTDYYLWCSSDKLETRLFSDFECDTCLVVTKPDIFINKMLDAVLFACSGWINGSQMIEYVDPLVSPHKGLDALNCKHFRYWYQSEHRLFWVPPERKDRLEPIFVEIGPLHDLAEVVMLP